MAQNENYVNRNTADVELHVCEDGAVETSFDVDATEETYLDVDSSAGKCGRYKIYVIVAFIAVFATIAAFVVYTFLGRDGAEESLSSTSSSISGEVDITFPYTSTPSLTPSQFPSYTKEPSSYPSTKPSSSAYPTTTPSKYPTTTPSLTPSSNPSYSAMPTSSTSPSSSPTASASPTTSKFPSSNPTLSASPSSAPTDSLAPTYAPTTASPTRQPTPHPTLRPTPQQIKGCVTNSVYDEIDRDIDRLQNRITNVKKKAHFLGGIVRLVAHDFMDYDQNDFDSPMGPDGCFDADHPANAGLPDDIWCDDCLLTELYEDKYTHIGRADFWIASANAVIRQTSVDNALDLRDTFEWGRKDARSCSGSGRRVPSPRGCDQTRAAFLTRMGLSWRDATALMGAHTLGRGDEDFSGHHGTWVGSNTDALVFDKAYYDEVLSNSWRPRNVDSALENWTTGDGEDRVMLNTDLCLVMDLDNMPCCTGSSCTGSGSGLSKCPLLPENHPRSEAFEAFEEFLGGSDPNDNQAPFYNAFRESWRKATKVGQNNLQPLVDSCDVDPI